MFFRKKKRGEEREEGEEEEGGREKEGEREGRRKDQEEKTFFMIC